MATHVRVPPRGIITRQRSDMLVVDNVKVAHALRAIRDRYADADLQIADVAASAGNRL